MFPYEWAREFLEHKLAHQLPSNLKGAAAEIVQLHLDPANFRMPAEYDQEVLRAALADGAGATEVRQFIKFEPTDTMLGIARVMARTHLNRSGVGRVSRGARGDKTLAPRVLGIFGSGSGFQPDLCKFRHLVETWYELACTLRNDADSASQFDETDMESLDQLRQLGGDLVARIEEHDLTPRALTQTFPEVHDNWCKVVLGVHSGLRYLKRAFGLDAERLWGALLRVSEFDDVRGLTDAARSAVYEFGEALAPSFFADLGPPCFCKPDLHVIKCVEALKGHAPSKREAVDYVFQASVHLSTGGRKIWPREIDKIMFLACSGRWYLLDRRNRLSAWARTQKEFLAALVAHAPGSARASVLQDTVPRASAPVVPDTSKAKGRRGKDKFGRRIGSGAAACNVHITPDRPRTIKQLIELSGYANTPNHITHLLRQGFAARTPDGILQIAELRDDKVIRLCRP